MRVELSPVPALASRYKLALPVNPTRGLPGDHLSRGAGSSVEFQDFRHYVPGDDPRHIDWHAVGRTDQLIVRLHREEVRLCVDILLDASRSLARPDEEKGERAIQCAYLFSLLARKLGAQVAVWILGDRVYPLRQGLEQRLAELSLEGRLSLAQVLEQTPLRLALGSIRLLISDFLFPHDPQRLYSRFGRGAGGVALLQVLSKREREPEEEGSVRFVDVETGEERQLVVRAEAIRLYRERLRCLKEGLARVCLAYHSPFVSVPAEEELEAWCRGSLTEAGILEPS